MKNELAKKIAAHLLVGWILFVVFWCFVLTQSTEEVLMFITMGASILSAAGLLYVLYVPLQEERSHRKYERLMMARNIINNKGSSFGKHDALEYMYKEKHDFSYINLGAKYNNGYKFEGHFSEYQGVQAVGGIFDGIKLYEVSFTESRFLLTNWENALFTKCSFLNCNFNGSSFMGATFVGQVNFYESDLTNVWFSACEFGDCNFSKAIFSITVPTIFRNVTFNGNTQFPEVDDWWAHSHIPTHFTKDPEFKEFFVSSEPDYLVRFKCYGLAFFTIEGMQKLGLINASGLRIAP